MVSMRLLYSSPLCQLRLGGSGGIDVEEQSAQEVEGLLPDVRR